MTTETPHVAPSVAITARMTICDITDQSRHGEQASGR
jgi:hypothetical protein